MSSYKNIQWISYNGNSTLNIPNGKSPLQVLNETSPVREDSSIIFKKIFHISSNVESAVISICGLGLYKLYINGSCVNDLTFDPLITQYDKRILFDTYDVKKHLSKGENVICVEVSGGYFSPAKKYWGWRMVWLGNPKLSLKLDLLEANGNKSTIQTDDSWLVSKGGYIKNCIYDGVTVDLRKYDTLTWKQACIAKSPCETMDKNIYPQVKICEKYLPDYFCAIDDKNSIYGFPYNKTGIIKVGVKGNSGDSLTIRHAEVLSEDALDYTSNRNAENTDTVILAKNGITYITFWFTYHGFKYVHCTKSSSDMEIIFIEQQSLRSDLETVGEFFSDNSEINKLHNVCVNTMKNSYFGLPLDCPQRDERLGWYGDAHVTSETSIYNFDMRDFYKKCFDDLAYGTSEDGFIPLISPRSINESSIDFSGGFHIILSYYYKYYNDVRELNKHFSTLVNYLYALESQYTDLILPRGNYGDWSSCEPSFKRGDPDYSDTLFFYYLISITKQFAILLRKESDLSKLCRLKDTLKDSLLKLYYDSETKNFGDGSIYSNSFSLFLELIPQEDCSSVLKNLVDKIKEKDYCLFTGIFGTKFTLEVLYQYNCFDVLEKVILNKKYPGWMNMIKNSTTLTERWDAKSDSLNHGMFSSVDTSIYKLYSGINIDFSNECPLVIKPYFFGECTTVSAKTSLCDSEVSIIWDKTEENIYIKTYCPANIKKMLDLSYFKFKKATLNGTVFEEKTYLTDGENNIIINL